MGLENLITAGKLNSNSETRKTKKPLIEKQRRKRINDSLHELKRLVLEALHRDVTLYEKMEKADVLDMTVNYLKTATQSTKPKQENATDPAGYQAGYRQCQEHITRVLITDPAINTNQKSHIISHFAVARPAITLNLRRQPHAFVPTSTYPIHSHFPTTPPSSPIPSPTTKHPVSPMDGLALLSRAAVLTPKRLSHSESLTTTDAVWRPWQAGTSGK